MLTASQSDIDVSVNDVERAHWSTLPPEIFLTIVEFLVVMCQRDIASGEWRPACKSLLNLLLIDRKSHRLTLSRYEHLLQVKLPAAQMTLFRSIASASRNSHALSLQQLISSVGRLWKNKHFAAERQAVSNLTSALIRDDACEWFQICFPGISDMTLSYSTTRIFDLVSRRIKDSDTLGDGSWVLAVASTDERYLDSRPSVRLLSNEQYCTRVEVWHDLRFIGREKDLRGHWRELNSTYSSFRKSWIWVCRRHYLNTTSPDPDAECFFFYDPETTIAWNSSGELLPIEGRRRSQVFLLETFSNLRL